MLTATIAALKSIGETAKTIIGLKKEAREDEKRVLEMKKLERDLSTTENRIVPPTFEEIKEIDPKIRAIRAIVSRNNPELSPRGQAVLDASKHRRSRHPYRKIWYLWYIVLFGAGITSLRMVPPIGWGEYIFISIMGFIMLLLIMGLFYCIRRR